jgi:tetratricopeptide (TPR) repeat protein
MLSTKSSRIISAVVIAFLLAGTPAFAQKDLWRTYEAAGEKAYGKGNYKEAEKLFEEALQAARRSGAGILDLERTLVNLAITYKEVARYEEAEKLVKEAIALIDADGKFNPGSKMLALNNLATIYATQGKLPEAIDLYKQSLDIANKTFGVGKQDSMLPAINLGQLYIQCGDYVSANNYLQTLFPLFKQPRNQTGLNYAYFIYSYGQLAAERGKYAEAEKLFLDAIQVATKSLGADHRYVAGGYQTLAEMYTKQGRYSEAEQLLQKAVGVMERSMGADNPQTASTLQALASNYVASGEYAKARPVCDRVLAICDKAFGKNHVSSSEVKTILARLEEQNGNYPEAERLLKEALQQRQATFGQNSPRVRTVYKEMGKLYFEQGNYSLSEEYLQKALAIADQKVIGQHPEIAEINKLLSRTLAKENKLSEATAASQQALTALEATFGKTSPKYAEGLRDVANIYLLQQNFKGAEELLKQVVAIDEQNSKEPGSVAMLSSDYDMLVKAYVGLNDSALAREMIAKSQELKKQLPSSRYVKEAEATAAVPMPAATAGTPVADKWALVVGISNFKDPSINLKYATKDAIDFRNFLINKAHFQPDHVKLLTDAEATRESIIGQLGDKWLGRLANRDDLVVIYVSSHGSSAQEAANGVNFLVAHDTRKDSLLATGIPMQWLTSIIKDQVHSDRVVMILDVCHGGAASDASKGLVRSNGVDLDGLTLGKGQAVLCSSLADQLSWESKTYQNSVFTRRLIEALSAEGEKTTLQTAYKQLRDSVESEVLRDRGQLQTPVLNQKLWSGADAMLCVKPTKPRPGLNGN